MRVGWSFLRLESRRILRQYFFYSRNYSDNAAAFVIETKNYDSIKTR